jgi:flagellar biosynthesis GTPase FlhF
MASSVECDDDDEYFGWAFDAVTKEWVSANKATKGGAYICTCPGKHPVILRKGEIRRPHFAHLPVFDADRTKDRTSCGGGGESQLHLNAKHKLRELQGQYTTVLGNCSRCGKCVSTDFTDGRIEIEVRSDDNSYRYDAVYTGADGQKTALEIWHKHETGFDKVNKTREAGMKLVEFKARDVFDMKPDAMTLNHKPDKTALCVDAAACMARIEAMEAAEAKAAEERRMEMERQRLQQELEMERQRLQRELEMEAARKAAEERSRRMEEQRRQREFEMEAHRRAEEERSKLDMERKRKRFDEIMKAKDQEIARIARDVYNYKGPMPIPVPSGSGFTDRSTPDDWGDWWRRYPQRNGPSGPCAAQGLYGVAPAPLRLHAS